MEEWGKPSIWLIEASCCPVARSAVILQTHQGDSHLDFGEGRKEGWLCCPVHFCYVSSPQWLANTWWSAQQHDPGNLPVLGDLVQQQHWKLSPLVNGSAQLCDLTRLNTANKIVLGHMQLLSIKPCKHAVLLSPQSSKVNFNTPWCFLEVKGNQVPVEIWE